MDILVDPNVAYLLLIVGVVLAIMALFAPGTGVLEVGALFVLFLAGWEISQQAINLWALVLLILGVVPFILAMRKSRNLVFLVIALLAFVIGSAYLFQSTTWWQPGVNPVLAIIASALASGYLWIAATKVLETDKLKPRHDLSKLIGNIGEARTDIHTEGSIQLGSELWSARSEEPIHSGSKVKVLKREGFILEVEALPEEEH
ncbi:MAG TPA: NfeD family protein [Anaerolineales bacterium]|nr:NfeD family protein [Anaerolineales bacterium]